MDTGVFRVVHDAVIDGEIAIVLLAGECEMIARFGDHTTIGLVGPRIRELTPTKILSSSLKL